MGLLDRIRSGIGAAGQSVENAARSAAGAVTEGAERAAEAVTEAATGATRAAGEAAEAARVQFQQFANDPGALARQVSVGASRVERNIPHEVRGYLHDVGDAITSAGRRIQDTTEDLRDATSEGVQDGLRALGRAAEGVGRDVAELRQDLARGARELGQEAVEAGERVIGLADRGIDEIRQRGEAFADGVRQRGEEALDTIRGAGERVLEAGRDLRDRAVGELDPNTQLDRLREGREGDSVKVRLGGFVQAQVYGVPVRGQAAGELELRRLSNGFAVDVSGQAGVGLYAPIPRTDAGGVDVNGVLQAGGKATMEFTVPPYRNLDEAQEGAARATRAVARQAAAIAARGAGGPLLGTAAGALIGPSDEDVRLLRDSVREVEVRGGLAVQVAGELEGGPGRVSGQLSGSAETGVRIRLPGRDESGAERGARVTVFQEASIAAEGEAATRFLGPAGRAGIEGRVTLSREFELPRDATAESLLTRPRDTIRAIRDRTVARDPTLSIEGQVRGGGGGSLNLSAGGAGVSAHGGAQAGVRFQLQVAGPRDDVVAAARTASGGDLQGALATLDRRVRVSGEVGTFASTDVSFSPSFLDEKSRQGAGIEAQYRHARRGEAVRLPELPPGEALRRLQAGLGEVDPRLLRA